jgi:beta-glucosidase
MRPPKELKGFAKVSLNPGESKTISFALDFRAFAYYHPAYKQWVTEDGEFDLLIGASSADIRCVQTVTLHSTVDLPCILNRKSTLREWLADPRGNRVIVPFVQQFTAQIQAALGGDDGTAVIGLEANDFLMDLPMLDLLHFQSSLASPAPEDIVDALLLQVHNQNQ